VARLLLLLLIQTLLLHQSASVVANPKISSSTNLLVLVLLLLIQTLLLHQFVAAAMSRRCPPVPSSFSSKDEELG